MPDDDEADDDEPSVDSFIRRVAQVETSSVRMDRLVLIGSRVGRYEIVKRIGVGGMGIVYEARDTELERRVALKLVRPRVALEDAQRRLRREAQAMAKLPSKYCVAIHDIGNHGDKVFIAMELVTGGTLRQWIAEPRPWREVVERFLPLGRGLAAAHSAGIIHRDFKPENVLLTADGEIRIADFGLARSLGTFDSVAPGAAPAAPATETASELAGTPAYMAPEQLTQDNPIPIDARADQFAFCVALYEALEGARPFAPAGSDFATIARAVLAGERRGWTQKLPAWLREAVERGLARDRDQRWPAMPDLVAALDAGLRRRWWWPFAR